MPVLFVSWLGLQFTAINNPCEDLCLMDPGQECLVRSGKKGGAATAFIELLI